MNVDDNSVFSRPTQLSIKQIQELIQRLMHLCEKGEEFASRLDEDGFAAFKPQWEFEESFCSTPEELACHRKHAGEFAKEHFSARMLGRLPFVDRQVLLKYLYKSSVIDELLQTAPNVDKQSDNARNICEPCNWRNEQLRQKDFDAWHQRLSATAGLAAAQFRKETRQHRTTLGKEAGNTRASRCRLFNVAAEYHGKRIGLLFDKAKSIRLQPAVVREIGAGWELRWAIEHSDKFVPKSGTCHEDERIFHAWFKPELFICRADHPATMLAKDGVLLQIDYTVFVPGFRFGYDYFFDNDELETNVKAHLTLIGYVIDDILTATKSILG